MYGHYHTRALTRENVCVTQTAGDATLVSLVAAQLQKQGHFVGVAVMAQQGGELQQGD